MAEQTIQDRYLELLKAYVGPPAEESLFAAAELGRELVLAGVPPKDIAELHEGALQRLAQEMPDVTLLDAARLISTPLMELLMAYGLAFRERLEARDRAEEALQEYSERLEEMVEERTQELRRPGTTAAPGKAGHAGPTGRRRGPRVAQPVGRHLQRCVLSQHGAARR